MASGSTNDITFIVPGQAQDVPAATSSSSRSPTGRRSFFTPPPHAT